MSRLEKVFRKLSKSSTNVQFSELQWLVEHVGFEFKRQSKSSHLIYKHPKIEGIESLINIQNVNGQAKPYQVEQILQLIDQYGLIEKNDS